MEYGIFRKTEGIILKNLKHFSVAVQKSYFSKRWNF
jgi:hypothetical protein